MRILLGIPLLLIAACGGASFASGGENVPPSGSGTQRSYAVRDFTGVALAGPDSAVVTLGPAFSVRAEGDPAALDRLVIEKKGSDLLIRRKSDWGLSGGGGEDRVARVHVTLPRLGSVSLAGSGSMRVDRAEGDRFDASIAGSGDVEVGALRVGEVDASVSGSGRLRAAGTAERLSIDVAGSGRVEAPGLVARSADVSVAGSGKVLARVNGAATVSIAGSGVIDLGPQARCSGKAIGSGQIRCG